MTRFCTDNNRRNANNRPRQRSAVTATRWQPLKLAFACLACAWLVAAWDASDATAGARESNGAGVPGAAAWELAKNYHCENGGKTLIVMHAGKILFEDYANGGRLHKPEPIASGSKGFVGAAALAAVDDGILKLDDAACGAIEEWRKDPPKSQITYRQLLTLTSGMRPRSPGGGWKTPAWKEVVAFPLAGKPGAQFAYGETHHNAFAYALELRLINETFVAYLKRRVLDPLGIRVTWALKCADGHPQAAGGALVTARDWAKFGEWIRLRGIWNGRQVIAADLFDELWKNAAQNPAYGLAWWVKNAKTAFPVSWLPDMLIARGTGGQKLFVIPSLELVIARQASLDEARKSRFDEMRFLSLALRGKADASGMRRRSQSISQPEA